MRHQRNRLRPLRWRLWRGRLPTCIPAATVTSIPSCEASSCAIIGRLKEPPRRRCDGDQGALHRRVLLVRLPSPASLRDQPSPRVRREAGVRDSNRSDLTSGAGRGSRAFRC